MYQVIHNVRVWGTPDESAVSQMSACARAGSVAQAALMADHHKGYSQPIGGVVAYRDRQVSPSGVGYDIACGNKAARTNLKYADLQPDIARLMDTLSRTIAFGIGRANATPVDHELFDDPAWRDVGALQALKPLARQQLGTVGSGNHYVDLFVEPATDDVWVGVHFGSRGFGYKTAAGFLNLAGGRKFDDKAPAGESMDQPPTLLSLDTAVGQDYLRAMRLAGRYAYAGRDHVVRQVLARLGALPTFEVHNHHNFAWLEEHDGEKVWVVRKGATPCFPGQLGFVGGSMTDLSVIVRGKESDESRAALYSTVHGAGRIMSRTRAAGKMNWKTRTRQGGIITRQMMSDAVKEAGVILRGAGTDESPFVYRKLQDVLNAHAETLEVLHVLKPVGVIMAGEGEVDPYKD